MSIPGKLLYHLWHRPAGYTRDLWLDGGPWQRRRTESGRREMESIASHLPPLSPADQQFPAITLHLLTGARFWYQTAFCLHSFASRARRPVHPVLYDDGTLAPRFRDPLLRLFPAARVVTLDEQRETLERHLPADRFPALRERWQTYPHIRKIIAPHLGSTGWKLVIDSDLLFFRRPDLLIDWLDQPERPLHAIDCTESYGYPRELMEKLAGHSIAPLVNVGLAGMRSDAIDWDALERWTSTLITRHGPSYLLEQGLVAMLMAGRECTVAPAADYVTNPVEPEARDCRAVMHHYVANSKRWYFGQNWRRFQTAAPSPR